MTNIEVTDDSSRKPRIIERIGQLARKATIIATGAAIFATAACKGTADAEVETPKGYDGIEAVQHLEPNSSRDITLLNDTKVDVRCSDEFQKVLDVTVQSGQYEGAEHILVYSNDKSSLQPINGYSFSEVPDCPSGP